MLSCDATQAITPEANLRMLLTSMAIINAEYELSRIGVLAYFVRHTVRCFGALERLCCARTCQADSCRGLPAVISVVDKGQE
jgi:tRNA G26 N,N-dimethylase Trm1